jgi:hypothetical protein
VWSNFDGLSGVFLAYVKAAVWAGLLVGLVFSLLWALFWQDYRECALYAIVTYAGIMLGYLVISISRGIAHFLLAMSALLLTGVVLYIVLTMIFEAATTLGFPGNLIGKLGTYAAFEDRHTNTFPTGPDAGKTPGPPRSRG